MNLLTVREVSRKIGCPITRLRYLISTHSEIEPDARVNIVRLFGPESVEKLRQIVKENPPQARSPNGTRSPRGYRKARRGRKAVVST